MLKNKSW